MHVSPPPASRLRNSGSRPATPIKVETAIRALVTKSANDVAVIVAETLAGDESQFAKL